VTRRILATGASGFVGRRLVPALVRSGFSIVAPVREPQPAQDGVAFPLFDSIENADWPRLLDGVDAVVHLAGIAHTKSGNEASYDAVNAEATLRMARACVGRLSRFVFASSVRAITGPTSAQMLDDDTLPAPTDAYGRSKLKAEKGLALLDLPTTILRPVVIYGAGVKGNLARLARLANSSAPLPFGALRAPRSFLSIDNFVSAVLFALARTAATESFVLADPDPSSLADFLACLRAGLGRPAGLLNVSPSLLGAAAGIAGQGDNWRLLSGPLAVQPRSLLEAGWLPSVCSSGEGARLWGEAMRVA
jgi:nucleoside-diphosphate-sugar epimerase